MKCSKCNCTLPDDSEFCTYCGAKILLKNKDSAPLINSGKPLSHDQNEHHISHSRFCSRCGTKLESKTKKCPSCGKTLFPIKPLVISITCMILVAAVTLLTLYFIVPEIKYQKALSLIEQNEYIEANKVLKDLQGYKNSSSLIHTHSYSEVVERVEATCEHDGYIIEKCSCGETRKTTLHGGHSYTKATCTEPEKCTVCGTIGSAALGHDTEYAFCPRCEKKLFETKTYSGYEAGNITGITLPDGKYNVTLTYTGSSYGSGNFIVTGLNGNIWVNEIGKTSYVCQVTSRKMFPIKNDIINIESATEGKWTVTIEAYE